MVLVFTRVFLSVLGTRFGSLKSAKIIIGSLKSERIGSLEQRNRVPIGPFQVSNIFLKKTLVFTRVPEQGLLLVSGLY